MGSPIAQNIVMLGGLVVQIVTLCYLIKYVRATVGMQKAAGAQTQASQDLVKVGNEQAQASRELVKAANEQSEGLSKPVIFARSTARQDSFLNIQLVNIGTGPAIEIGGSVVEDPGSSQGKRLCFQRPIPYLEAHQEYWTRVMGAAPGQPKRTVECSYRSISGLKYVSMTQLDDRNMVSDFRVQADDASAA
ncbi:MAG: hypothetical protein ABSC21_03795 [Terriglobia bacterium]|jgi:hypothetical protein